jgi:hypothetical protein
MHFFEFFAANIRNPHVRRATPAPRRNFWPGERAPACRRSPPFSRCTSPPGSRSGHAGWPRRASSNCWLRFVTSSTGSSPARWCRSTWQARCASRGTL